jgi:hypothetical protein
MAERIESEVGETPDPKLRKENPLAPLLQTGSRELPPEEPLANLAKSVAQLTNELEADVFKELVFAS